MKTLHLNLNSGLTNLPVYSNRSKNHNREQYTNIMVNNKLVKVTNRKGTSQETAKPKLQFMSERIISKVA